MPIASIRNVQGRRTLLLAAGCLLCAALAWKHQINLDGSEFSGGHLTGPLLAMNDVGSGLFVLGMILIFFYSKTAAASAMVASLLCSPLYLYFLFPKLFRRAFPGEYAVPLQAFGWDGWSIAGILLIAAVVYFCCRALLRRRNEGTVRAGSAAT
jgi:hypothetical protein